MPFGKGRQPDKPGTYRVKPTKDGGFKLSGVKANGERVRMAGFGSYKQAEDLAATLFPKTTAVVHAVEDWSKTDDWGMPLRVSDETIASVAGAFKLPDPNKLNDMGKPPEGIAVIPPPKPEPSPEDREKLEKRRKNAKSLMDLVAIGGSAGTVMIGRKLCEAVDKEPVKPDAKNVSDLRESLRDALTDMFGDSEIEPWKMALLLAFGIPLSMLIQSPPKKRKPEDEAKAPGNLKSVP